MDFVSYRPPYFDSLARFWPDFIRSFFHLFINFILLLITDLILAKHYLFTEL